MTILSNNIFIAKMYETEEVLNVYGTNIPAYYTPFDPMRLRFKMADVYEAAIGESYALNPKASSTCKAWRCTLDTRRTRLDCAPDPLLVIKGYSKHSGSYLHMGQVLLLLQYLNPEAFNQTVSQLNSTFKAYATCFPSLAK